MSVIELNYPIDGILILLNEVCLLSRYYPLIPYKTVLTEKLSAKGCGTKRDCAKLTDAELMQAGLPDTATAALFRSFLRLYDLSSQKMREIEISAADNKEKAAFQELYCLPGVKLTRARLYYQSGYTNLHTIAGALPEEIIAAA